MDNERLDSGFNKYAYRYLQALKEMDYSEFDNNFIDIYENGKYIIDGNDYDIKEIYLVIVDDVKRFVIKAGINTDIITGEKFNGKKTRIICLRDTSLFYKLYTDGIIKDKNIHIDKNILKQYVSDWDLEKHYMVPELKADKVANDYLKENNN